MTFSNSTPVRGTPHDATDVDGKQTERSRRLPTWSAFVGHREAVEHAESAAWRLEESKPERPSPYRKATSPPPTQTERAALLALLNPEIGSWSRSPRSSPRPRRSRSPNEQIKDLKGQLAQAHALLEYQRLQMQDFAIKAEEAVTMQGAASLEILCTLLSQQQQSALPSAASGSSEKGELSDRSDVSTDTADLLPQPSTETQTLAAPSPSINGPTQRTLFARTKKRLAGLKEKLASRIRRVSWVSLVLVLFVVAALVQSVWIFVSAWKEDPEKMMFILAKLVPNPWS